MIRLNNILKLILILVLINVLFSCKSVEPCPDKTNQGNIGSVFNTNQNEYAPSYIEGRMYFSSSRDDVNGSDAIYYAEYIDGDFYNLREDKFLPLKNQEKSGLPVFYQNGDITELYFSATGNRNGNSSRDIFFSKREAGRWSLPKRLNNVNTEYYESYPCISHDGNYLLFISDREGSIGEIDIYISKRNPDGSWSEAVNLGPDINTEFTELSPHLDENNNLYYSSKGFSDNSNFDIVIAKPVSDFKWQNPRLLNIPINTDYNETGPFVLDGKIYFSSDRTGGCGGEDIYAFDLCGPVFVRGEIIRENSNIPISGEVDITDENDSLVANKSIDETGKFNFNVEPMKEYKVTYHNDCFTDFIPAKSFITPCSDSSSVVMKFNFVLPDMQADFDFAEYDIPFFVTGYYYPNTAKNLEELKLKFSYNLFNDSPETKYIENPEEKYDEYTELVESALHDASSFVNKVLNSVNTECASQSLNSIEITVNGFSDPRQISETALYSDNDINDDIMGINILKGTKMDNKLLSVLRAYYTAKFIEEQLKSTTDYNKLLPKLNWKIIGKGIDVSDKDNKLKRRVQITITVN